MGSFDYDDPDEIEFAYQQLQQQRQQGLDGPAELRKADRAKAKRIAELEAELEKATASLAELNKTVASRTVADVLKAKGANPALQKFMSDVDPTEEGVTAWLTENGELFGYKPQAQESDAPDQGTLAPVQGVDPAMAEMFQQMARVQNHEANAAPGLAGQQKILESLQQIDANAQSFEDVTKGLRDLGIPLG
ncbi:MAG: hypothetical protein ACXVGA_00960 [Mycobacteriaceae bacterium]